MGLLTPYWFCHWEDLDFLDLTHAFDISYDLPLFTTWHRGHRLLSPPLGLQIRAFLPFKPLTTSSTNLLLDPSIGLINGERALKWTVRFLACDSLGVIYGGRRPLLPLLITSARRRLESRGR